MILLKKTGLSKVKFVAYSETKNYSFAFMIKEGIFARHPGISTPKLCDLKNNLTWHWEENLFSECSDCQYGFGQETRGSFWLVEIVAFSY